MGALTNSAGAGASPSRRAQEFFSEQMQKISRRTDGIFIWLMPCQFIAALAAALWLSPRTWAGAQSSIHPHLWAALVLGSVVTVVPLLFARMHPGTPLTRHVIAVGQMLMSALLIHLTDGRIETHFHVFGSLAFLAFYRDRKVLLSATVVVALDHFLRGVYMPQSVFGVLAASPFRWLEHAGWVIFEDVFLLISIRQAHDAMLVIAERQTQMEITNESVERKVAERTAELTNEIAERQRAEMATEQLNKQLLDVSRQAGMAEVATSVLHNVGNVLNSVNVSAGVVLGRLHKSRLGNLAAGIVLLREHHEACGDFFTHHPKGKQLPAFFDAIVGDLIKERTALMQEVQELQQNIDHIKQIVSSQQANARISGVLEVLAADPLVEDALNLAAAGLARHHVKVVRDFQPVPPILTDRHKVLQILINLITNAKHALDHRTEDRQLTLRVVPRGTDGVSIEVTDNGAGISPENLNRIFRHGFTTKKNGHGFGLHSGANAAKELGGHLVANSEGTGCGATFVLELPLSCQAVHSHAA
jgi:signal transduction histidine kinase